MSCPSPESLLAWIAGELAPKAGDRIERHVAGCASCRAEADAVADLRRLAAVALPPVPAGLRRRTLRALRAGGWSGLVERTGRVAELAVDTRREPIPAGARRTAPAARHLLFSALGYDVTVRVAAGRPGAARLSGQVLPGHDRPLDAVAGVEVGLERAGRAVAIAATNPMGEFVFERLPTGDYTAYVDLDDGLLVLPNIRIAKE